MENNLKEVVEVVEEVSLEEISMESDPGFNTACTWML